MVKEMFWRFVKEEEGLEMLEWALVAALFAVAGVAAWRTLGTQVSATLGTVATEGGLG